MAPRDHGPRGPCRGGANSVVRVGTLEAPGLDYARNRDVVEQMVRTLELR